MSEHGLSTYDQHLLSELTPYIEQGHEAHLGKLRTTPINAPVLLAQSTGVEIPDIHEYGPVLRESFEANVDRFTSQGIDIMPTLTATFLMNTLTEDNLPAYSRENGKVADQNEALGAWLGQWISEEQSHSTLLYLYGLHTSLLGKHIDLEYYQKAKDRQLRTGMDIEIKGLAQGFSYLSLQEDATAISHENLGWLLDKPGRTAIRKMSGDELRHRNFYAGLVAGLLEIDQDNTLIAIDEQFDDAAFHMPGQLGIVDFDKLASVIAIAGIFDKELLRAAKHGLLTKQWKIQNLHPYSDQAKAAQERLLEDNDPLSAKSQKSANRMASIRDRLIAKQERQTNIRPLIIGHTVHINRVEKQLTITA